MICMQAHVAGSSAVRAYGLVLVGVAVSLLLVDTALAQGIGGMANTAASQTDQVKEAAKRILQGVGVLSGGYGVYNWFRKGKEGENSRISGGQITVPILAGAGMGAISFLINTAGQTVGMPTVQ
ncbi:hypothetical protein L540_08055 [Bordetella pseudohinzii]|nr:hypothetical protein L540_08055 [Bordetella pseudohinzii]